MSGCRCSAPREFRITGEVCKRPQRDMIGSGSKAVRVRCSNCGGKISWVGSDLLTELLQIPESEIKSGRCLAEHEQRTLTVDLI